MRDILRRRFAAGFWPPRFRDLGEILGRILAAEIPRDVGRILAAEIPIDLAVFWSPRFRNLGEISAGFWPPRFLEISAGFWSPRFRNPKEI